MKSNVCIFLVLVLCASVFANHLYAQEIVQVGAGEYFTSFRTNEGNIYATLWNGKKYALKKLSVKHVADVDGAQYTNIAMDSSGSVYVIGNNSSGTPMVTPVPLDEKGNEFTGNSKVYGWYQGYLTIKDGNVWMWGQDLLNMNGGKEIPLPTQLVQPKEKKIKKLVVSTQGDYSVLALATDGSVWKYAYTTNGMPVQIKFKGIARDIAAIGAAAYVIETATDLLAWGYLGSYLGLSNMLTVPTSIKAKWTAVGCVFPSKQLIGNYSTLHIIDANNNMFGAGENVMGEVGNGKQHPAWRNNKPNAFAWSWAHGQLIAKPEQIPGKFKNLCTSNTITAYFYVQDMAGNWYSWGRNKARCLGNGITLGVNEEAMYPNFRNVPAPTLVTPLTQSWTIVKFDPNSPQDPLANAGVNQYINTSTTTLYGSGSSQQDGTITNYSWEKISGADCIIVSPSSMNTKVTGLSTGTYIFRLTVTNNNAATSFAEVTIVVSGMPEH